MHPLERYLSDEAYDALVARVACGSWLDIRAALVGAGLDPSPDLVDACAAAALFPSPITGGVDRDAIMVALGLVGNVWPASILPDVVREHVDHLRRQERKAAA